MDGKSASMNKLAWVQTVRDGISVSTVLVFSLKKGGGGEMGGGEGKKESLFDQPFRHLLMLLRERLGSHIRG